jgi:hypothetical protein
MNVGRKVFAGALCVQVKQTFGESMEPCGALHPHRTGRKTFEEVVNRAHRTSAPQNELNETGYNNRARDKKLSSKNMSGCVSRYNDLLYYHC